MSHNTSMKQVFYLRLSAGIDKEQTPKGTGQQQPIVEHNWPELTCGQGVLSIANGWQESCLCPLTGAIIGTNGISLRAVLLQLHLGD